MRVISIQSQVVHGHVGNSAAVFPMQAKGLEVAAIPTALLSNHPHYPTMHGRVLEPELVAGLLQGVEERGLIEASRVVVTGYLGSVENARVVARFIERAHNRNPDLIYVCDPVMGDDDLGIFVKEGLIETFRDSLVPMASVITPNQFELELLAGSKARSAEGLAMAADEIIRRGTGAVVTTGCVLDDTPDRSVETITRADGQLHRTSVMRLNMRPCGTGDIFTALLVAQLCAGRPLAEATETATREVFAILSRSPSDGPGSDGSGFGGSSSGGSGEMRIIGFPFSQFRSVEV
ncbi:pyridoxal kinase [Brucella gallinifaecis]|uniref:pyridoxal kinase n=2 Tax=Brucella gallinifaecis TaxID=215590 RepID=A0A502BPB0_9HYPH|nr:pyridoxal kinase [Brucella gallinifaecis]